ncbi:hypothetical protein VNO78_22041 [Psophocarpus tetragonolobus]|uniref:Uncharacterized protein n=1 Tax=Psophocarpus tetragonolobus TaxID=3891 RepID=A0AAN9SC20_PSOTE
MEAKKGWKLAGRSRRLKGGGGKEQAGGNQYQASNRLEVIGEAISSFFFSHILTNSKARDMWDVVEDERLFALKLDKIFIGDQKVWVNQTQFGMSFAKGKNFKTEKPILSKEAIGVSSQGKSHMNTAPVRGIPYVEAVKKFKDHDGSVLVEANSSVTISSQILQYKSLVKDVNHLSRAFVDKFSDDEMVLEAAMWRWEAVEKGFSLDEDKDNIASVQNAPIFDNLSSAEERSKQGIFADLAVLPKRHAKFSTINEETSLPKRTMQQRHTYLNGVVSQPFVRCEKSEQKISSPIVSGREKVVVLGCDSGSLVSQHAKEDSQCWASSGSRQPTVNPQVGCNMAPTSNHHFSIISNDSADSTLFGSTFAN